VGIEIIILICYSKYETLDKVSYDQMGTAAIVFVFILVVCCFLRILSGLYRKIKLLFDIPSPEWNNELA
jgi:hypothetical protein